MTLIILCAAALAGIAVAGLRPLAPFPLVGAGALALAAATLALGHRGRRMLALVVCAAALGAARGSLAADAPAPTSLAAGAEPLVGALAPARAAAQSAIAAYLPEPQASLAAGVLLGGPGHLDATFKQDLQRSGLGHLVAIDGFKQVLVSATIGGLAARLIGPRLALLPTLAAVAGYTLLAGSHPSAVRAALMVTLAALAGLSGRIADPLTSLGLALLAMATVDPRVLFDLGLQLSLSATLGIVLLWPILRRRLRLYRLPRLVGEAIGLSLAVSLACLPLTLSVFGLVSLVSPLAHVLAVPLLPLLLVGSAVLPLAAPVPLLGTTAAWLVWLPSSLLVAIIRLCGSLPGAAITTGRLPPMGSAMLAALLLAWGTWNMPELREARLAWSALRGRRHELLQPLGLMGACLVAAAGLHALVPDGRLHIDPLNLSRGQAAFIRGPTGETALVVLGSTDSVALATQVAEHLAVWEHTVDQVIALDASSNNALAPLLARYSPGQRLQADAIPVFLDLGGAQRVEIAVVDRRLEVRSAPPTSGARPESAN